MKIITLEDIKNNKKVKVYIEKSDKYLGSIGYTEHGFRHAKISAKIARNVLATLKCLQEEVELASISGYLHDIGNLMGRDFHAQGSAILASKILEDMGMETEDAATVMGAIGNHEDEEHIPADAVAAAVILADKSDVHRSRVRNPRMTKFDIHDRVNYAVKKSVLNVNCEKKKISLELIIDTNLSQVMEYFEIFLTRMNACRKAANLLNCSFNLIINNVKLL